MTKINLIFTILIIMLSVSFAVAQDNPPPRNDFERNNSRQKRDNMLVRELGLSDEQRQQIRKINQQRRPKMREAQKRFRLAKKGLDVLILADSLDEASLQAKLDEVIESQGEIVKIRTRSELAVRGVLTPDQLRIFRDLKAKLEEQQMRKARQERRRQQRRRMNNNRNRSPQKSTRPNRNRPL